MNQTEYINVIDEVIAKGKYKPAWESLSNYDMPEWYRRAKLGIFVHWGVYSVPAFGSEWYSRNMYIQGSKAYEHHIAKYGPQSEFGYKDFIPMFKGENFDADAWVSLFKRAGAGYVVPVAEHHDGFMMYDSDLSRFTSVNMGLHRDYLGELFSAAKKQNMAACASTHRLEHWFFMGRGREFDSDIAANSDRDDIYWPSLTPDPSFTDPDCGAQPPKEFLTDWVVRTCELIDRYRPKLIYFDWWIHHRSVKEQLRKIAAYYYNRAEEWGEKVVINYKYDAFAFGSAVLDLERGSSVSARPFFWQCCTSTSRSSWGFTENSDYKTANELIATLCDVVSKNGCMLLNVGPKADGTFAPEDEKLLCELGDWLKVNGEAIYGAIPWKKCGEGSECEKAGQFTDSKAPVYTSQDIRYTVNNGAIYAITLGEPENGKYVLKSFCFPKDIDAADGFVGIVDSVKLLGSDESVYFERNEDGLVIHASCKKGNISVFKIDVI